MRDVMRKAPDWVYVIRFSTGIVKVGYTKRADTRIRELGKHALAHRVTITDTWLSVVENGLAAEGDLMSAAVDLGGEPIPGNKEFFEGVDHGALVQHAEVWHGAYYENGHTMYGQMLANHAEDVARRRALRIA